MDDSGDVTNDGRRRRSRLPRLLLVTPVLLVIVLACGIGAFALWFRWAALRALPQLDGELSVPGLQASVSVLRDRTGTPHIRARNLEDLFFAQGFVTAQDRLFQMDLSRRYAAGELSEIMGSPLVRGAAAAAVLEQDRRQRFLQVRWAAERVAERAHPRDRSCFQAYARGVNAFIELNRDRLPVEFRVLGYRPRPWEPFHSVLVGTNISQAMNSQFPVEWMRDKFAKRLSPPMLDDLYVNGSPRDRAPGESWGAAAGRAGEAVAARVSLAAGEGRPPGSIAGCDGFPWPEALSGFEFPPGSNNWVVSGRHTSSGKPMLSNDMHLMHSVPGIWYQAHLSAEDFDVIGYTLPGLPCVIGGHNGRIAWGFTNLGPDVQDLYIENFNPRGEYETPSGWRRPEIRREVIPVKGKADLVLQVEVTRHGPIITPILKDEARKIALKWIVHEPMPQELPFFDVNSARDWQTFRAALSKYVAPAMNLVFADDRGNIGYQAAGRIPIRASGNGLSLVPGRDDAHEWVGYIPWEEMPSVYNPPEGLLATANSRIVPHGYQYLVANQWAAPHRTERIYRVLESTIAGGRRFTRSDMLDLQTDVYSDFDLQLARELARAVEGNARASSRAREMARILRAWDGRVTPDSAAAGLTGVAKQVMSKEVLKPKLGEDYTRYRWFGATNFWENLMLNRPPAWLPPGVSGYDSLYADIVELAVVDRGLPDVLDRFAYGTRFPLELNHPVFGSMPLLGKLSGPGKVPQRGNGNTVCQAGASFGPSQRLTVDFGELDRSTSNVVTGQSGQMLSGYYMDQFPLWLEGRTTELPFSPGAVEAAKSHRLTLLPR